MERLTKRDTDGQAMMDCEKCEADWTGKHGKPMADCTAMYCRNRLKDRLAAYEDRGLTPEEVLPKDKADEIALKLMRLADLESICSYTRLRELAEADVAPVVHTRWAHLGGDEWCCPVCGFVITTEGSWDKPTKKYCEDCGAKMDGGDSDAVD